MANTFGTDSLIQAEDPAAAARFYVEQLGFTVTAEKPILELKGPHINLYIEKGPALGPVLEVTVKDVEQAKARLVKASCKVIKDDPDFPRVYVQDLQRLIYNLTP